MNKKTLAAIRKHSLEEYPKEACGLVIREGRKEVYTPCKNIASEPEETFVLCPKDFASAEDKGKILMVVHSHPEGSCRPSEADKVMCSETQVPWMILSVYKDLITGEMNTDDYCIIEPEGYEAPLEGRSWNPPTLDCMSLIEDYYKRILDIEVPKFELAKRAGDWWEEEGAESLYLKHYEEAGFIKVDDGPKEHDVIIMEIASKAGPNHAGVYLGDDTGYFLHHLHSRLSGKDIYGGYWVRHTRMIVRHKELM